MSKVKHFPFQIDLDDPRIYDLIKLIKPHWSVNEIENESITGGFSSRLRLFKNQTNPKENLIVRIRDLFEGTSLNDAKFEIEVIKELSARKQFPKLRSVFQNGYVYDYICGRPVLSPPLTGTIFVENFPLKLIAEQLAKLHSNPIENMSTTSFFSKMRKLLTSDFEPEFNILPNKSQLMKEVESVEDFFNKFYPCTKPVLTHGDFHAFNIIQTPNGLVQFLDFEFTHLNHRAYDIAFFFQVLISIGLANDVVVSIPKNSELRFIENYLNVSKPTSEVYKLLAEVEAYKLAVLLFLIITQSVFNDLVPRVSKDPERYHKRLMQEYSTHKTKLFNGS